jgi:hypothetical protein
MVMELNPVRQNFPVACTCMYVICYHHYQDHFRPFGKKLLFK